MLGYDLFIQEFKICFWFYLLIFINCFDLTKFSPSIIHLLPFAVGRVPFSYLEDIHMRFMKNYGRVAHFALAYAMNDEFSRVLHQQMEYFSSNPSADALNRVRGEVAEAGFLT